jgi:hypothetical protein
MVSTIVLESSICADAEVSYRKVGQ